jgi:hypothetical protein
MGARSTRGTLLVAREENNSNCVDCGVEARSTMSRLPTGVKSKTGTHTRKLAELTSPLHLSIIFHLRISDGGDLVSPCMNSTTPGQLEEKDHPWKDACIILGMEKRSCSRAAIGGLSSLKHSGDLLLVHRDASAWWTVFSLPFLDDDSARLPVTG